MIKRYVKTKVNTNDHRRKRLTKMALRLVLSATTLSAILTGCGVSDNVTTEEVESDLIQVTTESEVAGEYSYLYDRLADTYGEFKVDVKEDGKTYTITVRVDDEEIFGYELTYDEATHIFTCNEDIILEESDLNKVGYDVELEDKESAYKVIYLDLEGSAEVTPNDTPVATNPSPTVNPNNNNIPKPPVTTPSTSTPSADNSNSNIVTPTTEEVKECQHNWVEVMTTKEEYSHTDHICLNCGFTSTNIDEYINHCEFSGCAGYVTHDDPVNAGWSPEDAVYQARIGKARRTTYTSKDRYNTIEVGTGSYYCSECYKTKQN